MSTTQVGPITAVDGPLPVEPPYNLFTVAESIGGRWLAGVHVWPYPPDVASGHDPCADGTYRDKHDGTGYDSPRFHSFTAYLPVSCSTIGNSLDEVEKRAEAVLNATDHVAAERQLVSGDFVANPYLAETTNILNGGSATLAQPALSYLEQEIGDETGRVGVIHADPATVAAWSYFGALRVVGNQLQTYQGTPVIVGAGYIGAHPDSTGNPAAGTSYAWATGPIQAERSNMSLSDNLADYLDVSINLYVYRAERNIVVGWDDLFSAAVLVDWTP
jgi:hypothetical protein